MSAPAKAPPVEVHTSHDGGLVRLILARPPANLLDTDAVLALRDAVGRVAADPRVRLVLFQGQGAHFCYGASVEEHLPGRVDAMLPAFHQLFVELEETGLPTAAAVRGRCLGGGAELALWCGTVHVTPDASLGVPEVKLGVFPPIAALGLRWRVGGAKATRLVTTGDAVRGADAVAMGLAEACTEDPEASIVGWYERALAPLSPHALRMAWRAARRPLLRGLHEDLPALEQLYLTDLMAHPDPEEGLRAFLERRQPTWRTA
ncbi:MAG: enoyl-CoA hydratase/isomerase family protein [Pseudomonadota bacterium]|nr:enoyl-CoA hydratase/isomerase family protein [Pseudomonadota bacterium]